MSLGKACWTGWSDIPWNQGKTRRPWGPVAARGPMLQTGEYASECLPPPCEIPCPPWNGIVVQRPSGSASYRLPATLAPLARSKSLRSTIETRQVSKWRERPTPVVHSGPPSLAAGAR